MWGKINKFEEEIGNFKIDGFEIFDEDVIWGEFLSKCYWKGIVWFFVLISNLLWFGFDYFVVFGNNCVSWYVYLLILLCFFKW